MAGAKVVRITARFHCLVPVHVAPDGVRAMECAKATVRGGNLDRYDTFAAFYHGTDRVVGATGVPEQMHVVEVVADKRCDS